MATDTDRKPILLTVDDDPGVSRAVARVCRYRGVLMQPAHSIRRRP
jgi:ActR/RegA family two-component response regulator